MTTEQLTGRENSLRELTIFIAEKLFGFKWVKPVGLTILPLNAILMSSEDAEKYSSEAIVGRPANYLECCARDLPDFAEDMNAAMLVEGRIKELGLVDKYVRALVHIITSQDCILMYTPEVFAIAHASAEERARAAVKMLNEIRTNKDQRDHPHEAAAR